MKCDVYIRKGSYANAVLPSDTKRVQEIIERITKELTVLAPLMMKLMVVAPPE